MTKESLKKTIFCRRSHRSYTDGGMSTDEKAAVSELIESVDGLFPEIKFRMRLLSRDEVTTRMPWMPEGAIALYSENSEGYLLNAGFILGIVDLELQGMGLGSCFVGLGKPAAPELGSYFGLPFVMMIAYGKSREPMRGSLLDFSRKELREISDTPDPRLEPARLAPSSINSQPWYFLHTGRGIALYQRRIGRSEGLRRMNRIDCGIALAYMYVSSDGGFTVYKETAPKELADSEYIISFTP